MNIEGVTLQRGKHVRREHGVCLLEAVAWFAGEPHTDKPACVCPVIAAFGRVWNDDLWVCEERQRLLRPLIPLMVGTVSTRDVEVQRRYLALDWLVRVHTPTWLQLVQNFTAHAERLRGLPEISDGANRHLVNPALIDTVKILPDLDARYAAKLAVRSSAGRAAWEVACVMYRDWAWVSSWDLIYTVALKASAAALKKGIDIEPTVQALQESAVDLLKRMCACGKPDKQ